MFRRENMKKEKQSYQHEENWILRRKGERFSSGNGKSRRKFVLHKKQFDYTILIINFCQYFDIYEVNIYRIFEMLYHLFSSNRGKFTFYRYIRYCKPSATPNKAIEIRNLVIYVHQYNVKVTEVCITFYTLNGVLNFK